MAGDSQSIEDEFLSVVTDGMVHNGLLLGETWEAVRNRKYKPPPSGVTVRVATHARDLTESEVQTAAQLYEAGRTTNPGLDLDDVMQHVLDQRPRLHAERDADRAHRLAPFLSCLLRPVAVKIKGAPRDLSPVQFAAHFGEQQAALALLAIDPGQAPEALFEACREGYAEVVAGLLASPLVAWDPHSLGHGFLLAARHDHLPVVAALTAFGRTRLDVLCHGPWFSGAVLGQRYIAVAVETALELRSAGLLAWLLDLRLLRAPEWTHCLTCGLRLASAPGHAHLYLPLLATLLAKQPSLATTVRQLRPSVPPADTGRLEAVCVTLLHDHYADLPPLHAGTEDMRYTKGH
ncbi:hypothetical protein ACHHYP_15809 [Achlya hypogyna]|uniref:Ankyrin repeat protein n=1 Tax=Achlya hypogyna TaxID=1202772 RepID=A0A1V9ZEQ7_ACHHY|nr:hypothetical protein ACHHYP_15809 [Achlya hypogyna]